MNKNWTQQREELLANLARIRQKGLSGDYLATTAEAAALLGVKPSQIRNAIHNKRFALQAIRHGRSVRFRLAELDVYLKSLSK